MDQNIRRSNQSPSTLKLKNTRGETASGLLVDETKVTHFRSASLPLKELAHLPVWKACDVLDVLAILAGHSIIPMAIKSITLEGFMKALVDYVTDVAVMKRLLKDTTRELESARRSTKTAGR